VGGAGRRPPPPPPTPSVADSAATAGAPAACEHGDQHHDGDRKNDSHGDQQVSLRKRHCETPFCMYENSSLYFFRPLSPPVIPAF
jgi:hypothetical protein